MLSCVANVAGYGKTVSHVIIGLKTVKGTKQLKLDPSIYESLQREKVEVGDVIYIESNSGAVKVCIAARLCLALLYMLLVLSVNLVMRWLNSAMFFIPVECGGLHM